MGSWTHKLEKRQKMKEYRQAARSDLAAGTAEEFIRTDGGDMSMHEMYGDGSDHEACQRCGFCVSCGDCAEHGCGLRAPNAK